MYTSIDLFSGPGGLCTGFKAAGIKPLIAIEWSYWTVQTYAASHNAEILILSEYLQDPDRFAHFFDRSEQEVLIYGDINKVKNELILKLLRERFGRSTVDVVTGGAPCESFSMAGQRKEDDERNQLFMDIPRIARCVKAKILLFENVKGLFSKKNDGEYGKMYTDICSYFEKKIPGRVSYRLASKDKSEVLLKASDYGVPQNRERVFLVGINNKYKKALFSYPEKTHGVGRQYNYVTVNDAISDLPKVDNGAERKKYVISSKRKKSKTQLEFLRWVRGEVYTPSDILFDPKQLTSHKAPGHVSRNIERLKLIKVGENQKTAFERIMKQDPNDENLKYFPKNLYAARNRRLKPNEPSFTVTSHCLDEMVHPTLNRAMTPREIARIQSFPDWYIFKGPYVQFHGDKEQDRYEQIGDAIPPLMAYALAKEIVKTLNGINREER